MKVSLIVPTYNQAHYLATALESCLSQDYPDFEVLAVNDGSTDSTKDLLDWFMGHSSNLFCLHSPENRGPAFAMNAGIAAASGDLVCFAASDDIQEPHKIRTLAEALGDADFCYSGYYHADIKGNPTLEVHPRLLSKETIRDNNAMSGGAILARRAVLQEVPFRNDLRVNEDMALAWDLLRAGKTFTMVDIPTFRYRLTKKSMSYARKAEVEAVTGQIIKEIDAS